MMAAKQQQTPQTQQTQNVPEMIDALRAGTLSRRTFVAALTALGVSAAGAAMIAAAALQRPPGAGAGALAEPVREHNEHLARQVRGDVESHMADYAADAVVDDPLFASPFVGKEQIAARYAAEVASAPNRSLTVLKRTVAGNQLVVEWEARGTHSAPYFGIGGQGHDYVLRGTTVVIRKNGKIVRESHFFDAEAFRRQVHVE